MESEKVFVMPLWFWSCRFTLAVLCCLAMMNMYAQQAAITSSFVCLTNSSVSHQQTPNTTCDLTGTEDQLREVASNVQQQLVLGPFVCGYILSLVPAAQLAGCAGGRKLLGTAHLIMSLASLLTPMAVQFMHSYTVAGLKFIAGLMAGATYPSVMSLWQNWAPPNERTRLLAITYSGIPLGLLLATSTRQVICFYGWLGGTSGLLYALGLLGTVWFILWMMLVSSSPPKNLRITEAEKQMISKCLTAGDGRADVESTETVWSLVHCAPFWSLALSVLSTEWGLYLLTSVVPVYLHTVSHVSLRQYFSGYFSTAPLCLFLAVILLSAAVTDRLISSQLQRSLTARKLLSVIGALVVAVGFVILCLVDCHHDNLVVVVITVATGCHGLQYIGVMVTPLEMSCRRAASVCALALTVANVAKFAASFAIGYIAALGSVEAWHILFYSSAGLSLVACVVFSLLIGRSASAPPHQSAAEQTLELVAQSATEDAPPMVRNTLPRPAGFPTPTAAVGFPDPRRYPQSDYTPPRYIDLIGPLENHVMRRQTSASQPDMSATATPAGAGSNYTASVHDLRYTHSQLISLV